MLNLFSYRALCFVRSFARTLWQLSYERSRFRDIYVIQATRKAPASRATIDLLIDFNCNLNLVQYLSLESMR